MLFNCQRGHMLLLPVSLMAVLFLLGGSYLHLSFNTKESTLLQGERIQAYYVAEAGVEMALARLAADSNWSVWAPEFAGPVEFAGGQIREVNVNKTATGPNWVTVQITSVGVYKKARKTLIVTARITRPSGDEEGKIAIVSWREKYGPF